MKYGIWTDTFDWFHLQKNMFYWKFSHLSKSLSETIWVESREQKFYRNMLCWNSLETLLKNKSVCESWNLAWTCFVIKFEIFILRLLNFESKRWTLLKEKTANSLVNNMRKVYTRLTSASDFLHRLVYTNNITIQ
jgi:hypothetical protein